METVRNLTVDQVCDMIRAIDTQLIPQCRDLDTYDEKDGVYRIGDYGYVSDKAYAKAFDDYVEQCGGAEWCRSLYMLEANQPELLEFYVMAYNIGGSGVLDVLLDKQFDDDNADNVYYTNGLGD